MSEQDKHGEDRILTPERRTRKHWIPGFIRHDFWRKFCAVAFAAVVTTMVYNSRSADSGEQNDMIYVKPLLHLPEKNNDGEYRWLNRGENIVVGVRISGDPETVAKLSRDSFALEHTITPQEIEQGAIRFSEKDLRFGDQNEAIKKRIDFGKIKVSISYNDKLPITTDRTGTSNRDAREEDKNALTCYRFVSRSLNITANYKSEDLPEGYYLEGNPVIFLPEDNASKPSDKVMVSGPESFFKNQNITVSTKLIPLKDQVASFTTVAELIPPAPDLELAYRRLPIQFNISRLKKDGPKNCPVSVLMSPEKAKLFDVKLKYTSAPSVALMVVGERKQIDTLSLTNLHPYVNLDGLSSAGVYKVKIGCIVDVPGVKVDRIEPSEMEVELIRRKAEK